MSIDWGELRRGIRETRTYLLSHHLPGEWHRCYTARPFGRRIRLCARCCGIYPGIALGVAAYVLGLSPAADFLLVWLCPAPALLDWALTAFTNRTGSNPIRTVTGASLGYGYGLGVGYVVGGHAGPTLAVGIAYALLAGALLYAAESGPGRAQI